jgi:SAM-dependent methyltransferase
MTSSTTTTGTATAYAFAGTEHTRVQLAAIQAYLDELTMRRVRELDLPRDGACWEIGAGAGSIAAWLARDVVPDGLVAASDVDVRLLAPADNLQVYRADVAADAPPPGGPWQLIHARLVTQHLPGRRDLVTALATQLAPGGWLLLGEFDCQTPPQVIAAPSTADAELFDMFIRTLLGVLTARGVDMAWATQVHTALIGAGLTGVHSLRHVESWTGGGYGCQLLTANSHQQHDALLAAGLRPADLDRVHQLLADPRLTVESYPFVSVRGQRPANPADGTATPADQR